MSMSSMHTSLEYVPVPSCAARLHPHELAKAQNIKTSFPRTPNASTSPITPASPGLPMSINLLPQLLLSPIPNLPSQDPRAGSSALLSSRNPLSIPITSANFRRFVPRVGPVFWLQDRIEEVLTWKRGWKVTLVWMAAYSFICVFFLKFCGRHLEPQLFIGYFPHMLLMVPHVIVLSIVLSTYPSSIADPSPGATPRVQSAASGAGEGTGDWQANLQGIQNLMGV
jgi:Integral peroxisomal membrane peroxin